MPILKSAHKNAKKGKTWYREVKEMEKKNRKMYYLKELQRRLKSKTYQTSDYKVFIKNDDGKQREIYKLPYFPDRIAQWAILLVVEPILKNKLILDTYSAIPGRGIHLGLQRLHRHMKDRAGTKYCLKMDVKKYYPSINHKILKQIYRKIFKDPNLLWLLDEIIDSTEGNTGIPIGNYLSQWSGNIYLAYFDHWMKEEIKCNYYHRYMDDIVILHHNKNFLHKLKRKVDDYLKENLKLRIKDNWQVFPTYKRGIDFLGYRSFGDYTLLRKSTAKKFKRKMRKIWDKVKLTDHDYMSINSYLGWVKWANCYNLLQKYINPLKNKIKEYERRNGIETSTV